MKSLPAHAAHDPRAHMFRRDQGEMSTGTALSGGVQTLLSGGGRRFGAPRDHERRSAGKRASERPRAAQSNRRSRSTSSASSRRAASAAWRRAVDQQIADHEHERARAKPHGAARRHPGPHEQAERANARPASTRNSASAWPRSPSDARSRRRRAPISSNSEVKNPPMLPAQ